MMNLKPMLIMSEQESKDFVKRHVKYDTELGGYRWSSYTIMADTKNSHIVNMTKGLRDLADDEYDAIINFQAAKEVLLKMRDLLKQREMEKEVIAA
jgi:hypothetical protein